MKIAFDAIESVIFEAEKDHISYIRALNSYIFRQQW